MNLKLRVGMLAAATALLAGCGPAAAGTSGGTRDVASPPAVSSSPTQQLVAATPSPTMPATTSPAAPAVAGAGTTGGAPAPARTTTKAPAVHCDADHYLNSSGNCVHRPVTTPAAPAGATAECEDGTFSFSQHRQGTCSHHGGVKRWL